MRRALEILRSARFRAPVSCARASAQVAAESGLSFQHARARVGFARGHLLEVIVNLPGGSGAARESDAAEDLVRLILGEELFERWVFRVSATPGVRGGPLTVLNHRSDASAALPIESLLETVRTAIAALTHDFPALPSPSSSDSADWLMFELEPAALPDYARQDDLLLCTTRVPELKKSYLRGEPFFSGRFARADVLFAYLKYESEERALRARMEERSRLERLLSAAIDPEQGVLLGLGLGVRYSYLDFAFGDPDCIDERLLPALREAGISPRAWFLFCDSELERSFIPVHADSPEPHWG